MSLLPFESNDSNHDDDRAENDGNTEDDDNHQLCKKCAIPCIELNARYMTVPHS